MLPGALRHEYTYAHPSTLSGTPRAESVRQWFPLAMLAKYVQNNTTGHEPPRCLHSRLMAWRRTEGRLKHARAASIVPPHARGLISSTHEELYMFGGDWAFDTRQSSPPHLGLFCDKLGRLPRRPEAGAPLRVPRDHL